MSRDFLVFRVNDESTIFLLKDGIQFIRHSYTRFDPNFISVEFMLCRRSFEGSIAKLCYLFGARILSDANFYSLRMTMSLSWQFGLGFLYLYIE